MKIGIIGRTHILIDTARALVDAGHEVVFVYTCRAEAFYKAKESDFKQLAEELACPFFSDLNIYSRIRILKTLNADVCVSINWLTVLRDEFLKIFQYGVLNAHAGDLPRYKGNACPNWAILNFEERIAVTIHKMTEELDSGPYLLKKYFPLTEDTYIGEIYDWLDTVLPKGFVQGVGKLENSSFIEQDLHIRTLRTYPRKPEDARIFWGRSTRNILALVRASSKPFDGAFCFLNNEHPKLVIFKACQHIPEFDFHAAPGQVCFSLEGNPVIATKDGMIEIQECGFEDSEQAQSKQAILRSLRNRLT